LLVRLFCTGANGFARPAKNFRVFCCAGKSDTSAFIHLEPDESVDDIACSDAVTALLTSAGRVVTFPSRYRIPTVLPSEVSLPFDGIAAFMLPVVGLMRRCSAEASLLTVHATKSRLDLCVRCKERCVMRGNALHTFVQSARSVDVFILCLQCSENRSDCVRRKLHDGFGQHWQRVYVWKRPELSVGSR
jgi:hypothetical protein